MTQLDTKERRKGSALSYALRVLFRALIFRWIGRSDHRQSSEITLSIRVYQSNPNRTDGCMRYSLLLMQISG